jgi:hypothetical protein
MTELERSFGLIIAFLLPGFTCLCGFSAIFPMLSGWLSATPSRDPSVGGFLYVVIGSLAVGLVVSAIRWLVIDRVHHATGISRPELDYSRLNENLLAYQLAVEHNYRYFQFYANMAIAIVFFAICRQSALETWTLWINFGIVCLEGILLAASRDCLKRFYERVSLVLGTRPDADE